MNVVTNEDFENLNIRVGRVIDMQPFPEGRYSTHILLMDFDPEISTKKSLARPAPKYQSNDLVGGLVLCVVNVPPGQICKHKSEVLTLEVNDENGNVVVKRPDRNVPLGGNLS